MTLADLNIFFKSSKLKSDISLFHFERKGAPIKIHVRFEAGSADDPESKQGLAHFLEHMMVVGTKSFPTKDLLSQALEKLGCSFGAFTNKETITIHFSIPSKNEIEPLKDIIREILFEPLFSEKAFEQERKAIISEIGEKKSNPAKYIWELYGKVFFKESPHGQSTLGTAESLQKIKLEDLKNYYKKILSSSRIALLSAGDVSIEKLASAFETLPFAHQHAEEVKYGEGKVESITENFKTDNSYINAGYKIQSPNFQDFVALDVFRNYLASSRSSQLIKKLRYEKGLVYGCGAGIRLLKPCAVFSVSTSCRPEYTEQVVGIICDEIKSCISINENIKKDRISEIIDYSIRSAPFRLETSESIVNNHIELLTCFDKPYTADDHTLELKNMTPEKIKTALAKYFKEENFASAVLMPQGLRR